MNDGYNRGSNRSREGSFSENYGSNKTKSMRNSTSSSGSKASTNRDSIRCYIAENMITLQGTLPPLEKKEI